MNEIDYLLWFLSIDGIRGRQAFKAIRHFRSAKNIYHYYMEAPDTVITKINKEKIKKSQNTFDILKYKDTMEELDIHFLPIIDEKFPKQLKNISNPPLGLYMKGNLELLNSLNYKKALSIIGSRKRTSYGEEIAYNFAYELSKEDIIIVSGMALGIDRKAHEGVIDAKGETIAVLANGLDICYPKKNQDIYNIISKDGLLLSEYPLGRTPERYFFSKRNRLISGLSEGLIVVEAREKSGTNLTVSHGLEQGKEIFAVPGSIYNPYSEGTNRLIADGAYPALSTGEILRILGYENNKLKNDKTENNITKTNELENINNNKKDKELRIDTQKKKTIAKDKYATKVKHLEEDEQLVYNCVSLEGVTVDNLVNLTKVPIEKLLSILLKLELGGLIIKKPGQQYIKNE